MRAAPPQLSRPAIPEWSPARRAAAIELEDALIRATELINGLWPDDREWVEFQRDLERAALGIQLVRAEMSLP